MGGHNTAIIYRRGETADDTTDLQVTAGRVGLGGRGGQHTAKNSKANERGQQEQVENLLIGNGIIWRG